MKERHFMKDYTELLLNIADRYPQWAEELRLVNISESLYVRPAGNDGQRIYVHPRIMNYYTDDTRSFYLAQQFLHLKLGHFARGEGKNQKYWKLASDAVVNSMLKADGFPVPEDVLIIPGADNSSAEKQYELLMSDREDDDDDEGYSDIVEVPVPEGQTKQAGKSMEARQREMDIPGLSELISGLAEMLEPSMQIDHDWFPGRTVRDGVLRHEFRAYPVAYSEVLLDTSASVDEELLRAFVRGVKGLLKQDAVLRVGCFDTRFYGFRDVRNEQDIAELEFVGAGGTDFNAAVNAFTGDAENKIIFTDGYAEIPEQRCDAIWIIYGNRSIQPEGGRVLYGKLPTEKEKHEVDFLIT